MSDNRWANIVKTGDMEGQDNMPVPSDILEYRSLDKPDLVNKVVEARQELASLKKVDLNLPEIKTVLQGKDKFAIAQELYILRTTIVDVKKIQSKDKDKKAKDVKAKE